MVSDEYMGMVKGVLKYDTPRPLRDVSRELGREQGTIRRVLKAMAKLGLVKQVDLSGPSWRGPKKGWVLVK
jgi:DNA-binding IclR family transcriptional regulator